MGMGKGARWWLVALGVLNAGAACHDDDAFDADASAIDAAIDDVPTIDGGGACLARQIAAGVDHTCAVAITGTLLCWGNNSAGQLGVAPTTMPLANAPLRVPGLAAPVAEVEVGPGRTCARLVDGSVACWGTLIAGQPAQPVTPVKLSENASGLALGGQHQCVLGDDGLVSCWGAAGRVGDGTDDPRAMPVTLTALGAVRQIAAGGEATCALGAAAMPGTPACWGRDLGWFGVDGGPSDTLAPTPARAWGDDLAVISVGDALACGVRQSGDIACVAPGAPLDERAHASAVAIATGQSHACAVDNKGRVLCWGAGPALGDVAPGNAGDAVPFSLPAAAQAADVAAGERHTCALTRDGRVFCWGTNATGQLGDGTTQDRPMPVAVAWPPTCD